MLCCVCREALQADDVMVRKDGNEYATSGVGSQLMDLKLAQCCDKLEVMRWKTWKV